MSLGSRLKELRNAFGKKISQEAFSESIGVTRPAFVAYELDKVVPTDAVIKSICATYGISYAWLKDGIGPMVLPPDTDDELVDEIMVGSNEFAKSVMKAFAKVGKENPVLWDLLKQLTDEIQKSGR